MTLDCIRLRNPKLEDLGEVIPDAEIMENYYLYDDKEIYVQEIIKEKNFEQQTATTMSNFYHIITREWNPQTWQLGPIFEVKIDKMI